LLGPTAVIDAPVHEASPTRPVPAPATLDDVTRVLGRVVAALDAAPVPYVLLGGLASSLLGRGRHSTDIDVLVKPEDAEHALAALARDGFETERTNRHWLYKGFMDQVLVDVLFKAKGDIYLDDEMLARASTLGFRGQLVRVISPEDLVVIKAIVHDEETPRHWHDALGVLAGSAIDWEYLARRARKSPARVLSLLLYAQSLGLAVPLAALRRLTAVVLADDAGDEA
jgi:predicted nucleotidyltransferase